MPCHAALFGSAFREIPAILEQALEASERRDIPPRVDQISILNGQHGWKEVNVCR
jgi:hypothetical protein